MADERPTVNVSTGSRIKTEAERNAEAIRVNRGTDDKPFPQIDEKPLDPDNKFAGIEMSREEIEGRKRMEDFFNLPADQQKAKLATVLDRGLVFDRLKVDLPPDLHGEWPRNDPLEIARMRTLGFWIDDTYATRRALHSDGSSANIVGDVIHMVTTKENKAMIDRVRNEMQERSMRNPRKAIEEEGVGFGAQSKPDRDIPTFSESNQRSVTAADVRAALAVADGQTRVQR